jgi:hypothetical protein
VRILFIDDRRSEIERLISQSGIGRDHQVQMHMFRSIEACLSETLRFIPDIIFIGHGLSAYPITGSQVIQFLRAEGITARFIANSGGGQVLFENDGVAVDGSVNRIPGKIAELCAI